MDCREKEMSLISVVIPVYNVEKYIRRCVQSVISQTYRNLEIILVDDGSTDNSGLLCDEIAKIDDRIVVFHKSNGGLSDARNFGTERSSGEFITYIDSDDYVSFNYIEYLYDLIVLNEADIACCGHIKTMEDDLDFTAQYPKTEYKVMSGYDACKALLNTSLYLELVVAWGKLYKMSIVKAYPFPKGHYHEDEATTAKYFYSSSQVVIGTQQLYAYFVNLKGIMHNYLDQQKKASAIVWAMEYRALFFDQVGASELAMYAWGRVVIHMISEEINYGLKFKKKVIEIKKNHQLAPKIKVKVYIYLFSIKLYQRIFK